MSLYGCLKGEGGYQKDGTIRVRRVHSDAAVDDTPDLYNSGIMRTEFKPADGVQVTVVRSAMTVMEYWWEERSDRSCEGDSVFARLGLPTHGTDAKESWFSQGWIILSIGLRSRTDTMVLCARGSVKE
ncbi:hypothetical protein B0H14DRAFT_2599736 [Mycena olivaceomarginata]|nr:hypothetical protein B0H14DRAFT_2599736 [Mycena olivaceomarginata]